MKPVIDIRRIGPDAYAWRIRTDSVEVQEGSGFASMAQCLRHAGAALDADCARFDISFEGMFLGDYAAEVLRHHPEGLAQRIVQHCLPA